MRLSRILLFLALPFFAPALAAEPALDRAEVIRAVEDALISRLDADATLRVTSVGLPRGIPEGKTTLIVREPEGTLPAASSVRVDVLVDGRQVGRAWAHVEVFREKPVLALARSARKGSILEAGDLEVRRVRAAAAARRLSDPEQAVGKRLVRNLTAGALLSGADLEHPPAVERGDLIRIVVRVGGVSATAVGRALHAAGVGDSLRVENVSSNRAIQGVLREPGVVEVSSD